MKKLHKKLRKIADLIDLNNLDQITKLRAFAMSCEALDVYNSLRFYEEIARKNKISAKKHELLVNSIKTPDGTILVSRHVHDFVCHEDSITNTRYCLDGGTEYRRLITSGEYVDLSVYSDDTFEKIRESLERGSSGKNYDLDFAWIKLKDMSDEWLGELIPWLEANQPNNKYKKYYLQEIEYRKENGINVKEEE
jgi:hypothetical protein